MWSLSRGSGLLLLLVFLCSPMFSSTYFEISEEELTELETILSAQESRLQMQAETLSELSSIIEMQEIALERQINLTLTLSNTIERLGTSFSEYESAVRRGQIVTAIGSAGVGFALGFLATLIIGGR